MPETAPLGPFTERDSVQAPEALEVLQTAPETHLSGVEKDALQAFSERLFTLPPQAEETRVDLQEVNKMNTLANTQTFYLDYFQTAEGHKSVAGLGVHAADANGVVAALYSGAAEGTAVPLAERRKAAIESNNWYKKTISEHLAGNPTEDGRYLDSPKVTVNFAPEKLLQKFEVLQQFRTFYRSVSQEVQAGESTRVQAAQTTLLQLHWAKVNNMVASLYPAVLNLAEQIQNSPATEKTVAWQKRLFAAAPVIRQAFKEQAEDKTEFSNDFTRRLDLVRNGAEYAAAGSFSPISSAAEELAQSIEEQSQTAGEDLPAVVSPEVIERLDTTRWGAPELKAFLESMLTDWQLLSSEQTDWQSVADRVGKTTDQKWQVIVTPKVDSLSVDGIKGTMSVPESFDRTLAQMSPAGALPVAAHELTHVLQAESDTALAAQLPLAIVKGRRSATGREMGGIYEESRLQELLGRRRPTNTAYLRGLQTKSNGGNQVQVARTIFDSLTTGQNLTDTELQAKRKQAADRMLRLYRNGGHDSQPLDYLEQDLLVQSMQTLPAEQVRAIASSGGSFSLVDVAALHRIGVVELPKTTVRKPAEEVLSKYLELYQNAND